MKTTTRRQLGGPCDSALRGDSADEVIKAQDRDLRDAIAQVDEAHRPALDEMRGRWKRPLAAMGWYHSTRRASADLPEG